MELFPLFKQFSFTEASWKRPNFIDKLTIVIADKCTNDVVSYEAAFWLDRQRSSSRAFPEERDYKLWGSIVKKTTQSFKRDESGYGKITLPGEFMQRNVLKIH